MKNTKYINSLIGIIKLAKYIKKANLEKFVEKFKDIFFKTITSRIKYLSIVKSEQLENSLGLRVKLKYLPEKRQKQNVLVIKNLIKFLRQEKIRDIPPISRNNIFFYIVLANGFGLEDLQNFNTIRDKENFIIHSLKLLKVVSKQNDYHIDREQYLDFDFNFKETGVEMVTEPESLSEKNYQVALSTLKRYQSYIDSINNSSLWDEEFIKKKGKILEIPNKDKIIFLGRIIGDVCFSFEREIKEIIKIDINFRKFEETLDILKKFLKRHPELEDLDSYF